MGEEAHELGLLDRSVEHDQLIEQSLKLANEIAVRPPLAMRAAKRQGVGSGFASRSPESAAGMVGEPVIAGTPGRIRTLDPQIRSLMLYPLSYRRTNGSAGYTHRGPRPPSHGLCGTTDHK